MNKNLLIALVFGLATACGPSTSIIPEVSPNDNGGDDGGVVSTNDASENDSNTNADDVVSPANDSSSSHDCGNDGEHDASDSGHTAASDAGHDSGNDVDAGKVCYTKCDNDCDDCNLVCSHSCSYGGSAWNDCSWKCNNEKEDCYTVCFNVTGCTNH